MNLFEQQKRKVEANIAKSYGEIELLKAIEGEELSKGKRAQIGEIREWMDGKYQRTSTGWKPLPGTSSYSHLHDEDFSKQMMQESGYIWQGKIENLDKILSVHYDEMKEGDKKLKDDIFYKYYRFFNDRDVKKFPAEKLRKLGLDDESVEVLKLGLDLPKRSYYKNEEIASKQMSKDTERQMRSYSSKKYQNAMDNAIKTTVSYFKSKYPDFFSQEGREKTIQTWKKEIVDILNRDISTGLDKYWVSDYGKKFGLKELEKYYPHSEENKKKEGSERFKITDPKEKFEIMNKIMSNFLNV